MSEQSEKVVAELKTIVAEVGPDFRYLGRRTWDEERQEYIHWTQDDAKNVWDSGVEVSMDCSYLPDQVNPFGCIVGYFLRRTNLATVGQLYELEGNAAAVLCYRLNVLDDDSRTVLDAVQKAQDKGAPWSEAVAGVSVEPLRGW